MGKAKQKKVDKSLDMTFPASDPPAVGGVTGTEPPARPTNREAPVVKPQDVEAAAEERPEARPAGPRPRSRAAQASTTTGDLFGRLPRWVKSLHDMENELRHAARNGLILRHEQVTQHLMEARRHLDEVVRQAKGEEPPNGPQTPLRKEGEF